MRIVAGRFGGRRLKGPEHAGLRPTAERVREAIYNVLGARVADARVLDLFAGTGGLGLEALSRGAVSAVFVERERRAVSLLRTNLAALGLAPGEAEVIPGDAIAALRRLAGQGRRFELILADPPYDAGMADRTLAAVVETGLLAPGGLLVWEHRANQAIAAPPGLILADKRTYGDTALSYYRRAPSDQRRETSDE